MSNPRVQSRFPKQLAIRECKRDDRSIVGTGVHDQAIIDHQRRAGHAVLGRLGRQLLHHVFSPQKPTRCQIHCDENTFTGVGVYTLCGDRRCGTRTVSHGVLVSRPHLGFPLHFAIGGIQRHEPLFAFLVPSRHCIVALNDHRRHADPASSSPADHRASGGERIDEGCLGGDSVSVLAEELGPIIGLHVIATTRISHQRDCKLENKRIAHGKLPNFL